MSRLRPTDAAAEGSDWGSGWERLGGDEPGAVRTDRLRGPGFAVGHFRCPPRASQWRTENVIGEGDLLVVPHRAVEIAQAGRPRVVANPGQAVFYNAGQVYRRGLLDPRGDDCVFFAIPRGTLNEIVSHVTGRARSSEREPFEFNRGPIEPADYLAYTRLFRALRRGDLDTSLGASEAVLHFVEAMVRRAATADGSVPARVAAARQRDVCEAVERVLCLRYGDAIGLQTIADDVGVSPYHLARTFKTHTGRTIHGYRSVIRLHVALQRLEDPRVRLTDLALELGYASHAHFSDQFKRAFGCTPTEARRDAGRRQALRARFRKPAPGRSI